MLQNPFYPSPKIQMTHPWLNAVLRSCPSGVSGPGHSLSGWGHTSGCFHPHLCVVSPANAQSTGFIPWLVLLPTPPGAQETLVVPGPTVGEKDQGPPWPGRCSDGQKGVELTHDGCLSLPSASLPAHFTTPTPLRPPQPSEAWPKPANKGRSDQEGNAGRRGMG